MILLCIDPGPFRCGIARLTEPTDRRFQARYLGCAHVATADVLGMAITHEGPVALEGVRWHPVERSQGPCLVDTALIAGELRGVRRQFTDHAFIEHPASVWRRRLLGSAAQGAKETAISHMVRRALEMFCEGFPKLTAGGASTTTEHGRDALGLGLVVWSELNRKG